MNGEARREIVRIDTRTAKIDGRWPMPHCESPHGVAVDAPGHQLFATCKKSLMQVFDTPADRIVAEPPIGRGTDSAAYDPVRKRALSATRIDGDISVIKQTFERRLYAAGVCEDRAQRQNHGRRPRHRASRGFDSHPPPPTIWIVDC